MSSSPRAQHLQDADSLVLLNLCLLVWRRYVPVTNRHLVMPLRTSVIVDSTDNQTGWVSPILRIWTMVKKFTDFTVIIVSQNFVII